MSPPWSPGWQSVPSGQPGTPAQETTAREPWKTGTQFRQQLEASVGIRWAANPLRQALHSLSHSQGVAIFLDRRVDPDQKIDFSVSDTPLRDLLQTLAKQLQLGTCRVGPVIYVGPSRTAAVLAAIAAEKDDQVQRLPAAIRSRLLATRPLTLPELSSPRAVVEQLSRDVGLTVADSGRIPHDLWPAIDLPPLTWAQRMSLVLAGFDLTFDFDPEGATIRLVPLPADAELERNYSTLRTKAETLAAEVARRFPAARVTAQPGKLTVRGPIEVHQWLEETLRGPPAKPPASKTKPQGQVVFKLKIENKPVGGVATAVAKQTGREIQFDPRITDKLPTLVSFEVQGATLEELLQTMLAPVGLTFQLNAKTLRILPAE